MKLTKEEKALYESLAFALPKTNEQLSRKLFDRTREDEERDIAFLQAWADAQTSERVTLLPDLNYTRASESYVIEPKGKLKVEKFAPGLYNAGFREPAEWPPLLYSLQQEPRAGLPKLFLTPEGAIQPINGLVQAHDSKSARYGGFALRPNPKAGCYDIERPMTSEEFKRLYPLCAAHGLSECTGYATALYARETADLYDKAPEVLERFRTMLKLFPSAEVHWVVPMWIRTYGWGIPEKDEQAQKGTIRGICTPYRTQLLLNDKLVWRTHLSIDGTPIPGVAYFDDDGKLIISDWCFREEVMNQEMFHGNLNKHNILTWVAGPCSDRFAKNQEHKVVAVGKSLYAPLCTRWDLLMTLLDEALPVTTPDEVVAALEKGYNGYMLTGGASCLYKVSKAWKQGGIAYSTIDLVGSKGAQIRGRDTTAEGPWSGIALALPTVMFPSWVTKLVLLEA